MAKRIFKGKVIKDAMQKTVVVEVSVPKKHRFYGKDMKLTKKLKAHDTLGCTKGDIVVVEESRPLSKTVAWVVLKKEEHIEVKKVIGKKK
jgi:small subunit ribosomal protein S17